MTLTSPAPLAEHHELVEFDSGVPELDDWLRRRARANQAGGASRTFVVCDGNRVVAYYALASGAVRTPEAPGRLKRNMPDPIPVAVLGRLAIDLSHQGRGIGRALVRDAGLRLLNAAEILGIRGVLVHAISDDARAFYEAVGFLPSPSDPMMLMIGLKDLINAVNA
ncbi:GNAT family N-acetyltransferase (plasmid) [Aliirhizobium terrae]|uniref:GNAT family N-acetyltransferase n=1 Tax=Terrirhizobium terrae TaxID=2926709 RepID=UPI002575D23C|nr:GNAT family N-acetyltransferase [Rhizobium sp. CC-CFT758]WJH38646.1 GNAT family N-acetyltransferase [Rhizobium sp. CC-CFT758]